MNQLVAKSKTKDLQEEDVDLRFASPPPQFCRGDFIILRFCDKNSKSLQAP